MMSVALKVLGSGMIGSAKLRRVKRGALRIERKFCS